MTRTHRFAFSTSQKIGIWLAVLFVVWQILKWPPVFEAMMKFVLAGIIPGTDITLSPETIFRGSIIVLVGIAVLIILWPILRDVRYKRRTSYLDLDETDAFVTGEQTTDTAPVPLAVPTVQPTFYVQPAAITGVSSDTTPSTGLRIGKLLGSALRFLRTRLAWLIPFTQRCYAKVITLYKTAMTRTKPLLHKANIACRIIYREAYLFGRLFYRWSIKQLKAFWRWLEPHLRHFDAWLEIKYRAISKNIAHKMQQNDTLSVMSDITSASKKTVSKLELGVKAQKAKAVTKTATKTAAHKAKPYVRKAHTTVKKTTTKVRARMTK